MKRKYRSWKTDPEIAKARAMLASGKVPLEILKSLPRLDRGSLTRIRQLMGIKPFKSGRKMDSFNKGSDKRLVRIKRMWEAGFSLITIAEHFELSKQRINQILNKDKQRARYLLTVALNRGDRQRPDFCEVCHKKCRPEGHHKDYSKPEAVEWLCRKCHSDRTRAHNAKTRREFLQFIKTKQTRKSQNP